MNKIICNTNNRLEQTKPSIVPVEIPVTGKIGFCLYNFDVAEPVDAYSPAELLQIRDSIEQAINDNCKVSEMDGQMFLWNFNL